MSWWKPLLGPLVEVFNGWRERRHELKMARHDLKKAKVYAEVDIAKARAQAAIDRLSARQEADINWEILSIKNSGWKDEYLTIFTSLIVLMIFLPWTQPFMLEGFEAMQATPVWFQVMVLVVYSSAFGVRAFQAFRGLLPGSPAKTTKVKVE